MFKNRQFLLLSLVAVFAGMLAFGGLAGADGGAAAPPLQGTVHEGESVPGVALGATRAEVYAEYGEPDRCQSLGVAGNAAVCTWILEDHPGQGGHAQSQVNTNFRAPDGGDASNSPDDVVTSISFYGLDGWVTSAGINTDLAARDRDAVFNAYPDAEETNSVFVTTLRDWGNGIQVRWQTEYLNQATLVNILIFTPREPPPPPPEREPAVLVSELDLAIVKRTVVGRVRVLNDLNWKARGAEVHATWTLPDGSTRAAQGTTDSFGLVELVLAKARRGTYTLTIDDVVLEDHDFDADGSVLSRTIVKRK
ncbi:MAG: hypothetical protein ACYTGZ_13450 [Planctomycetota bacterium]|jgi:hypothetical protein